MLKIKKISSLLLAGAMAITLTTMPAQAKEIDNNIQEIVTYNTANDALSENAQITASARISTNAKINASDVNLRKGPSTSYESIRLLQSGQRVQANNNYVVDASGRKWRYCVVEVNKQVYKGYVAYQYVTMD